MRLLTLLVIAAIPLVSCAEDVSVFEGKTAVAWVAEVVKASTQAVHENSNAAMETAIRLTRDHIDEAMEELGAECIKPLADALRKATTHAERDYLEEKMSTADGTPESRALVLSLLNDEHYAVRMAAITALMRPNHQDDKEILQAVRGTLKDKDKAVVRRARNCLEGMLAEQQKAVPQAALQPVFPKVPPTTDEKF